MIFNKLFQKGIRFEQGIFKQYSSFGNGFTRFSLQKKSFSFYLNEIRNRTRLPVKYNKHKFKITSMMGLVTISDSIKDALFKSEVIPNVIHQEKFTPKGFLMIQYKDSDKEVTMGNTLKPEDTQERPEIHFTLNLSEEELTKDIKIGKEDRFTLVVTDPDAPTRGDEKWSEYCHYLVKDIKLNEFGVEGNGQEGVENLTTVDLKGQELVPYMGPGPPPKTGLHRYVFLLYKQLGGDCPGAKGYAKLVESHERACWGTGVPSSGADEYAKANNLELYAVNFFYAKNAEQ